MKKIRLTKLEKLRFQEAKETVRFYELLTKPKTEEDLKLAEAHRQFKESVRKLVARGG